VTRHVLFQREAEDRGGEGEIMTAVLAHDVDARLCGGILVGRGEEGDLRLYDHVRGATEGTLWRLGAGAKVIGDSLLLVGGKAHEGRGTAETRRET
jgi:hypothetical protein